MANINSQNKAPTIIKDFLGQAVEIYRKSHHGFLPIEELQWIESICTAINAGLNKKITAAEIEELRKLAVAGSYAIGQNKGNLKNG